MTTVICSPANRYTPYPEGVGMSVPAGINTYSALAHVCASTCTNEDTDVVLVVTGTVYVLHLRVCVCVLVCKGTDVLLVVTGTRLLSLCMCCMCVCVCVCVDI